MWLGSQPEVGLAAAPSPGLPGCLTRAFPAGCLHSCHAQSLPQCPLSKGCLRLLSIQGLLGQWVRLEGCPCPDQMWVPFLVAPFRDNTPSPIPASTPPSPWAALIFDKR